MQSIDTADHTAAPGGRRADTAAGKLNILRRMSPWQTLGMLRRLAWARWSLRRADSVGKYVKLKGRLKVVNKGRLTVGDRVLLHADVATSELAILEGGELHIGKGAFLNYGAEVCATKRIVIGEECRIGTHCIIMDSDFHSLEPERRDEKPEGADVVLEPYVWLGNRVTVLKGVTIGRGSVVAAGSVVTKSIPPMSIAAGVPARVIRPIRKEAETGI